MSARRRKSKKRSGANSVKQPNDRYEFFVDECVAYKHVANMLRDAGHTAHVPGPDTFATGTKDIYWLPRVGACGWVLITKDKRIRKRKIELQALTEANVKAFVLTGGGLTGEEQAYVLCEALPAMIKLLRQRSAYFIALVTKSAKVVIVDRKKYID